ncbi:MAG: multicopper oxidase family protein [Myxococcota bacterium]
MKAHLALCLATLLVPAFAGAQKSAPPAGAAKRPMFVDPPKIESKRGVLKSVLTIQPTTIEIGGVEVTTELYNGLFAPPTLHVKPGDQLRLLLQNRRGGDEDFKNSNLHYHGTNVSPLGNSDNLWITVKPGGDFLYEVNFPKDHPQGLFWYHPHYHGTTEYQVGSGLSGLISVDGVLDPWPELKGITERYIILRDIQIKDGKVPNPPDPGNPTQRAVNGLVNPTIPIRPGEVQFWRIGNIGADIFYDLEIEGHKLYEIARDGIRHTQPVIRDHILMPTSSRVEFLVVGGKPGEYVFRTREIDMGPAGDPHPRTTLATMVVSGPRSKKIDLPKVFPERLDLRTVEASCNRTFDFSETPDGSIFCINNVGSDMSMVNTTVRIGGVEEWTINNCTGENHNFHHHQLQFQVVSVNGKEVPFTGWQDTVTVPYRAQKGKFKDRCRCDDQGNCYDCTCPTKDDPRGQVVVRIPYTNPIIEGKAVYHCHIGEHEDAGMMHTLEMSTDAGVCDPGTPSSTNRESIPSKKRALCVPSDKTHKHMGGDDTPSGYVPAEADNEAPAESKKSKRRKRRNK